MNITRIATWSFSGLVLALAISSMHPYMLRMQYIAETKTRLSTQQFALVHYNEMNDRITSQIKALLDLIPDAARVKVAFIHPPATTTTLIGSLRYDVTQEAIRSGHNPGETLTDRPLSEWTDFFSELMDNKCVMKSVDESLNTVLAERLRATGINSFLACPLFSDGKLLGSVFVSFDQAPAESFAVLEKQVRDVARSISNFAPLGL